MGIRDEGKDGRVLWGEGGGGGRTSYCQAVTQPFLASLANASASQATNHQTATSDTGPIKPNRCVAPTGQTHHFEHASCLATNAEEDFQPSAKTSASALAIQDPMARRSPAWAWPVWRLLSDSRGRKMKSRMREMRFSMSCTLTLPLCSGRGAQSRPIQPGSSSLEQKGFCFSFINTYKWQRADLTQPIVFRLPF